MQSRAFRKGSHQTSGASVGKVVAFPGHRPTDDQLRCILEILHNAGPISVRHLRMAANLPEDVLIKCVDHLADAGLLTAEDRKDGNTLHQIVSASDAGRRLLAAGGEDGASRGGSSEQEELA